MNILKCSSRHLLVCIYMHRVSYKLQPKRRNNNNAGAVTGYSMRYVFSLLHLCLLSFLTCSAWNLFQNEKCHLLVEHETQKLKALDESHNQNLKEWRDKLRPRKKVTTSGLVGSIVGFSPC